MLDHQNGGSILNSSQNDAILTSFTLLCWSIAVNYKAIACGGKIDAFTVQAKGFCL
jgi:hypothetical protein